jgi:hypothetical protein
MKLASLLIAALLLSAVGARAANDLTHEQKVQRATNLMAATRNACPMIPEKLKPYSLYSIERYVGQVVFPDLKMLSTAFLVGFEALDSRNLERGYCVVTFLGLPNDQAWEKNHDFYKQAKEAGTLPSVMFAGFDNDGNVLTKAIADVN